MTRTAKNLLEKHRAELRASGLGDAIIETSGIYSANGDLRDLLKWLPPGLNSWGNGFVIPFRTIDGEETGYCRVKLDFPRADERGKTIKYESPLKSPNRIYFPPRFKESLDAADEIILTEGEKKALCAQSHGIPAVGLVGVYGWVRLRAKDGAG